jgi:hypothetical protein
METDITSERAASGTHEPGETVLYEQRDFGPGQGRVRLGSRCRSGRRRSRAGFVI